MTVENKATFRIRLASLAPSKQLDIILAYTLAKFYHRAQTRKEMVDGKPMRYFEHLRRVAITLMDDLKIKDPHMIIACLLHDVLEDSDDISPELIEHSFGSEVVSIVKYLTKTGNDDYHERLKNCTDCRHAHTSYGSEGIFVTHFQTEDNALLFLRKEVAKIITGNYWDDYDWGQQILQMMYAEGEVVSAMLYFHSFQEVVRLSFTSSHFSDSEQL